MKPEITLNDCTKEELIDAIKELESNFYHLAHAVLVVVNANRFDDSNLEERELDHEIDEVSVEFAKKRLDYKTYMSKVAERHNIIKNDVYTMKDWNETATEEEINIALKMDRELNEIRNKQLALQSKLYQMKKERKENKPQ